MARARNHQALVLLNIRQHREQLIVERRQLQADFESKMADCRDIVESLRLITLASQIRQKKADTAD